jgi:hypothetical protein
LLPSATDFFYRTYPRGSPRLYLNGIGRQRDDGFKWGFQPFVQFTWADIFWRRGQFHLVSPFTQITAQTDFRLQDPVFGVGLFPVNISFDINDRLSIIGQLGVVGTYDLTNKRIEVGAQPAIFGSWSF